MTPEEIADLVKSFRRRAKDAEEFSKIATSRARPDWLSSAKEYAAAADALEAQQKKIESLRADVANAERRAEDAEARNVFLETEIAALAEKVKK